MSILSFARLLPSLLVLLAGCTGPSVSVAAERDPDFDFTKVKTFDWLSTPAELRTAVNETAVLDLIGAELQKKGLSRSKEQPDLRVAVQRTLEGTLNTKSAGYEIKSGRLVRHTLQEGTLVVDLVDVASRVSVWRGTATGAFRTDVSAEERRQFLAGVVRDMFADFPSAR